MMGMKKVEIVIIIVALVSVIIATTTVVVARPQVPESYWGNATLDDAPAPIDTSITVEVYETGEVVGNTTVADANGLYSLDVYISGDNYPDDGHALNGDNLTWKIDGINCSVPAPGTATAVIGGDNDNFNITASNPPAPTVLKPNGGEEMPGDSIYDIKWNVTNGTCSLAANPITIYNSINNGGSWTLIATEEANDGVYSWDVPNIDASSCLVKVEAEDEHGNTGNDTSDSVFTITYTSPPTPAPNITFFASPISCTRHRRSNQNFQPLY